MLLSVIFMFIFQSIKLLSIYGCQYILCKSRNHVNHLHSHVNVRYWPQKEWLWERHVPLCFRKHRNRSFLFSYLWITYGPYLSSAACDFISSWCTTINLRDLSVGINTMEAFAQHSCYIACRKTAWGTSVDLRSGPSSRRVGKGLEASPWLLCGEMLGLPAARRVRSPCEGTVHKQGACLVGSSAHHPVLRSQNWCLKV